jgi:hypothetical protein
VASARHKAPQNPCATALSLDFKASRRYHQRP